MIYIYTESDGVVNQVWYEKDRLKREEGNDYVKVIGLRKVFQRAKTDVEGNCNCHYQKEKEQSNTSSEIKYSSQ